MKRGFPFLVNTGGYDSSRLSNFSTESSISTCPILNSGAAKWRVSFCQAPDYPEKARTAIREMHRQVGDLKIDGRGLAQRGLLVRHLVLPRSLAGSGEVMHFLARKISQDTYVNIMDQYHPCGDIQPGSPLSRRITVDEFNEAIDAAKSEGLHRLDKREKFRLIWDI